ncbi:hypothetical protein MAP00_009244 [Monascus purpureus]|nr:hypothetical protein MAP00_009244 [Monascus purpureus]
MSHSQFHTYDYWQNQPDNYLCGPGAGILLSTVAWARGLPEGDRKVSYVIWKGRTKRLIDREGPQRTGNPRRPSNCPPLGPPGPVRTQVNPAGTPSRAPTGCGIWSSGGGPDPADTPANGGSCRAAPPGIWVSMMASGQRSTDSVSAGDHARAPGLQSPPQTAKHGPRGATAQASFRLQPHAQHRESCNLGTVNRSPKGQQRGTPRRRKPACSGGEADTWPWRPTAVRPQGVVGSPRS